MTSSTRRHLVAGGLAVLAAGAAGMLPRLGYAQEIIIAPREPPAPRYERVPPPPRDRREAVWEPGNWRWNGRRWIWVEGRYIDRPRRGAYYVPGHWEARGPGWAWIPPHWQ